LLLKILMGTLKNFYENYRQFGRALPKMVRQPCPTVFAKGVLWGRNNPFAKRVGAGVNHSMVFRPQLFQYQSINDIDETSPSVTITNYRTPL
jgi:hypothetical protein